MSGIEPQSLSFDLGNGAKVELSYSDKRLGGRQCGSCSLCCRLLPIPEIGKRAGQKCSLSRQNWRGCCTVYDDAVRMPRSCQQWSCRWLVDQELKLPRPDRAHYVVDVLPDFIQARPHDGGPAQRVPVVQIWVDPHHPHAHRDSRLRDWLAKSAEQTGMAAIIRGGVDDGLVLAPPTLTDNRQWQEIRANLVPQGGIGLWEKDNAT